MCEAMQSEQIGELAKALAAVQLELRPAPKNAQNPFLKNKYADLQACISTLQEVLPKNGLAYSQMIVPSEPGTISVDTLLMHSSGQWLKGRCTLPCQATTNRDGKASMNAAQAAGSAITYARRYGLSAIVGLVADDDDDGNAAAPAREQRKQAQAAQKAVREEAKADNAQHPTKEQLGAMFAALGEIGVKGAEACSTEICAIIGRNIKTSYELTRDEYQLVMREIEKIKHGEDEPF